MKKILVLFLLLTCLFLNFNLYAESKSEKKVAQKEEIVTLHPDKPTGKPVKDKDSGFWSCVEGGTQCWP